MFLEQSYIIMCLKWINTQYKQRNIPIKSLIKYNNYVLPNKISFHHAFLLELLAPLMATKTTVAEKSYAVIKFHTSS